MRRISGSGFAFLVIFVLTILFGISNFNAEATLSAATATPAASTVPPAEPAAQEDCPEPRIDFPAGDVRIYTMNWAYDGATIEFRNNGKTQTVPLKRRKSEYGYSHRLRLEAILTNVQPDRGFYLKVTGRDGRTIASFSHQATLTVEKTDSIHILVSSFDKKTPRLQLNGSELSLWPVGHEGGPAVPAEEEACNAAGLPRASNS